MMKRGLAAVLVVSSVLACAAAGQAGDNHGNHNDNSGSQFNPSFNRGNAAKQFQRWSGAIKSWKKKKHNEQPATEPPKPPVHPFPVPPKSPVHPFPVPPVVTDPIPVAEPIIRDHRDPRRPTWGKPIDASGAPGGTVVTTTPIIRDHRTGASQGGATITDVLGGKKTGPIIRDHRDGTGPIIRDHRK
jgi:hypothetical protein